jgi:3-oxoacyl-[acyl-carrier protein] reductase
MKAGLGGRTALVTGGGKGIGLAIARAFAAQGCRLHLVGRSADALRSAADEIARDFEVGVSVTAVDLKVRGAAARVLSECPHPDILVNNAGDIPGGTIETVDETKWRDSWDVKVFGSIDFVRLVLPSMKERGGGVIVNILGVAGDLLDATYIAGSVGNAALAAFTKAMGAWAPQFGIRVVGVNPGPVSTERLVRIQKSIATRTLGDESRWQEASQTYPFGRAATPEEVAAAVVFLASDASRYTSGAVLTIDGGMSAGRSMM